MLNEHTLGLLYDVSIGIVANEERRFIYINKLSKQNEMFASHSATARSYPVDTEFSMM
jgi:hypothetical protein